MALRPRIYYNAEQKAQMWDRWPVASSTVSTATDAPARPAISAASLSRFRTPAGARYIIAPVVRQLRQLGKTGNAIEHPAYLWRQCAMRIWIDLYNL